MDLSSMQSLARDVRSRYAEHERVTHGRSWTAEELMLGFVGDVGDLAKLVQAKEGVRAVGSDVDAALAHELADCLWSVLVIADAYDVDLERAFVTTMQQLQQRREG